MLDMELGYNRHSIFREAVVCNYGRMGDGACLYCKRPGAFGSGELEKQTFQYLGQLRELFQMSLLAFYGNYSVPSTVFCRIAFARYENLKMRQTHRGVHMS